jgi:hypothetical protein
MGEEQDLDYEGVLKKFYAEHKVWTYDNRPPHKGFPHPVEKTCESCPWATKDGLCSIANRAYTTLDGCPRPNFEDDLALTKATIENDDYKIFDREIIGAEVAFEVDLGGFKLKGVIDLVTKIDDETIEVIDFKSGNNTKSYNELKKDPQMRSYHLIAKKLWPEYKCRMMTLYYLRKLRPVTCAFDDDDDELTLKV